MSDRKQNLPQLYRFCFLMLGDLRKAQEVFNTTLREAAVRAAQGELPKESFWLFREARWRCLEASKMDLQPESLQIDEHDIAPRPRHRSSSSSPRNWQFGFPPLPILSGPRWRFFISTSSITLKFSTSPS